MRILAILLLAFVLLPASPACAQVLPPGSSPLSPPLPPPPPPPKIEVPAIPQLDALPSRNYVNPPVANSFGDRVTQCLDDGAAAGLGPNERSTYSRNCANR
jgi:hypothetical protein